MKNETPNDKNQVSRRSMLAASGAAVAATALTNGALATDKALTEVDQWKNLIGEEFRVLRAVHSRKRISTTLTLVGVEERNTADPNRPEHCRTPFTLVFVPTNSKGSFESGTYQLSNRLTGQTQLFVNETLNRKYSDQFVVQAVFG